MTEPVIAEVLAGARDDARGGQLRRLLEPSRPPAAKAVERGAFREEWFLEAPPTVSRPG
ncbi:MAG: hypothetical protein M3P95_03950 [Actinomycetota bacterium]|nr:hypothetical protein [Actinomycetota bacterium]